MQRVELETRNSITRSSALRFSRLLFCSLAASLLASCEPEVPVGLNAEIDQLALAAIEDGPITGVAVAVSRGTQIVHQAGYGFADFENEIPVTAETVFKIGSITKQFTAAVILGLAADGDLELQDTLTEYLPDYPGYGSAVTLTSLLNHTSGIRDYTTMAEWWERLTVETNPRRLIGAFRDEPFGFRPGTRFSYSNSGYVLLGWIAEQVTGRPFGGLLNQRLFVPLGLESTYYCDDRLLIPNRARGYQVAGDVFLHARPVDMSQAYAAGGVCSSALDLIRWTQLLTRGVAIGREGYRQMSTPGSLGNGNRIEYGYGLAVSYLEGHRRLSHVGGMLGFSSQIAHYEEDDVTVVVLTNTEEAGAASLESAIARLVLGVGEAEIRDLPLTPEELARYTGEYELSLTTVTVGAHEGRLRAVVTVPGLESVYTLLYQGDNHFVASSDSETSVTFDASAGRAERAVVRHQGITMEGVRID